MLRRLYVDNFRCFTGFELKPGKQAVIVGPNGSGKSSLFDLLGYLCDFLVNSRPAHELFLARTRTMWESRPIQRIELEVQGPNATTYHYLLEITQDLKGAGALGCHEELTLDGKPLYRTTEGEVQLYGDQGSSTPLTKFPFDRQRSFLPVLEPGHDNQHLTWFRGWFQRLFLFRLRPDKVETDTRQESRGIFRDASNFVSWYRTLQQEAPEITEKVREDLRAVIGGLSAMRLVPIGPEAKVLGFGYKPTGNGQDYDLGFHELSDGQRVLVVLYTILRKLAPEASLLVFDEPDNYLAQAEIQPWLSHLREAMSETDSTLLVVSHHPEVIDYLAADQALYLDRESGGPVRVRELEVDLDQGLRASEWIQLGVAGE